MGGGGGRGREEGSFTVEIAEEQGEGGREIAEEQGGGGGIAHRLSGPNLPHPSADSSKVNLRLSSWKGGRRVDCCKGLAIAVDGD
jgi:hypothetical protein